MQKIIPHLWFDKEAIEAAEFYVSLFPNSRITSTSKLENTPSGSTDIVSFELIGEEFQAISAGPYFKINPSISFMVRSNTKSEVDAIWEKLSPVGQVLMELGSYPFSERYGWVQDRFGLSWQLMYTGEGEIKQKITPFFLFANEVAGKAEEAIHFWKSVFHSESVDQFQYYGKGEIPDIEGTLKFGTFSLFNFGFAAMDSAYPHQFGFNEAISFIVKCDTQAEIDEYWEKLSAVPEAEQCGWLKDKYGVSWQITPTIMGTMLSGNDRNRIERVTQAFLVMKKLDIAKLQAVYDEK